MIPLYIKRFVLHYFALKFLFKLWYFLRTIGFRLCCRFFTSFLFKIAVIRINGGFLAYLMDCIILSILNICYDLNFGLCFIILWSVCVAFHLFLLLLTVFRRCWLVFKSCYFFFIWKLLLLKLLITLFCFAELLRLNCVVNIFLCGNFFLFWEFILIFDSDALLRFAALFWHMHATLFKSYVIWFRSANFNFIIFLFCLFLVIAYQIFDTLLPIIISAIVLITSTTT